MCFQKVNMGISIRFWEIFWLSIMGYVSSYIIQNNTDLFVSYRATYLMIVHFLILLPYSRNRVFIVTTYWFYHKSDEATSLLKDSRKNQNFILAIRFCELHKRKQCLGIFF